jgi:hypothetical protein
MARSACLGRRRAKQDRSIWAATRRGAASRARWALLRPVPARPRRPQASRAHLQVCGLGGRGAGPPRDREQVEWGGP